jgi:protocatechuate 3,4-dioxygenase, beta subunit
MPPVIKQDTLYTPRDWSVQPSNSFPGYKSTALRGPRKPLIPIPHGLSEITGPVFGHDSIGALDADLTQNGRKDGERAGEPLGERIIVTGRMRDEAGRPQAGQLIEIWQCNAAGRYVHVDEKHDAPLDPNFFGAGRCITDADGRYSFITIRPGAYPWGNHHNAWRPGHIHLSLFGPSFLTRLVTQMFFPGDPLLPLDPIFNAVPDEKSRHLLVANFSLEATKPNFALGYQFDITLRGRNATPFEV